MKIKKKRKIKDLNIIYIGNEEIGIEVLKKILKNRIKINFKSVITKKKSKQTLLLQKKYNLKFIYTGKKRINEFYSVLKKINPELIIEFGWSELFNEKILSLCPIIGQHPSLLPKRRGRAPITSSILDGLKKSAVTIFYLDKGVDSGNIIYQKKFKISNSDDSNSLLYKINNLLYFMIKKYIKRYPFNPSIKQNHKFATYTKKRSLKDSEINLDMNLKEIDRYKRALVEPYYPLPFLKNKYGDIIQLKEIRLIKKNVFYKKK